MAQIMTDRATRWSGAAAVACLLACGAAVVGCQEIEQPTTVLTAEQFREVQKHILKQEPNPKYKIGAKFDKVELIGFDVDTPLVPGQKSTFTWYWRALEDMSENWKVFVHLDSTSKPFRQNLDHQPVEGLYQTGRWKKGEIIEDIQEVTLMRNYPPGQATPYIGLFRGKKRMPVANDVPKTKEPQPRVIGPNLPVSGAAGAAKAAPTGSHKPSYAVRILDAEEVDMSLDGKLEEEVWKKLPAARLVPFNKGPAAQLTWAKVFRTDEHLYVGAYLQDKHVWGTLDERDADTWTQEVLELFIDPNGDGKDYLELQVTPQNTIFDARFAQQLGTAGAEGSRQEQIDRARAINLEGLESAVAVDGTLNKKGDEDRAWSVEMKIPLKSIPGVSQPPPAGATWAVNLYRFDRPEDDQQLAYAWSTAPRGDFHQVDKFGTFRFIDPGAAPAAPKLNPAMLQKMVDPNIKIVDPDDVLQGKTLKAPVKVEPKPKSAAEEKK